MTQREFFNAIANADIADELKAYAVDAIAKLDTKNAKRASKPSKTAIANTPILENILAYLTAEDKTLTSPDIAVALGLTTAKASALCGQLAKEGKVTKSEVKVPKKGKLIGYTIVK